MNFPVGGGGGMGGGMPMGGPSPMGPVGPSKPALPQPSRPQVGQKKTMTRGAVNRTNVAKPRVLQRGR